MPTARNKTLACPSDGPRSKRRSADEIEEAARTHLQHLLSYAKSPPSEIATFHDLEQALVPLVFSLGRLLLELFLAQKHEELVLPPFVDLDGRRYRRKRPQSRVLGTLFGKLRYWRTYMHAPKAGGHYPLDAKYKIPADGCSLSLVGLMVRFATKVSYAQVAELVLSVLHWSPSTTSVERAVLGLGQRTQAWFEQAPVPDGDGEVLVIMIDSKAAPTARPSELRKRRGKRRKQKAPRRRRSNRRSRSKTNRPRGLNGPHSKNGRGATVLLMYTLKPTSEGGQAFLQGPLNKWRYASFAPKEHAFEVARREANRRGFGPGSNKTIQIVVDGERCLELYAKRHFPEAIVTLDSIHAVEKLWDVAHALFRRGSRSASEWVHKQRSRLFRSKAHLILKDIKRELGMLPKRGPGTRSKRKRLSSAYAYLSNRVELMDYKRLREEDLEISSGAVEGAVRYLVGLRFDSCGMRWIPERAEALLQLRCIEANGDWEAFLRFVEQEAPDRKFSLQTATPNPLPALTTKAA